MSQRHSLYGSDPNWEMNYQDWFAVIGAATACFMAILDIQITNSSMREIQGSLGLDFSEGSWISTSYLVAEVIAISMTAFLSQVFGLKRLFIVSGSLFLFSSGLCGLAWNPSMMIFARVLQGLSGGALIPLAFQVVLLYMPPHKKNLGLALFGLISTLAPTLGPSMGGWLTDAYGWRSIFLINIFPGAILIFLLKLGLPGSRIHWARLRAIDIGGVATLILSLSAFTYMLEEGARVQWFEDTAIKVCLLIILTMFPLFIYIELTTKHPVLNLQLLAKADFALTAFMTMITAMALYGGVYALSLYLGQVQSYSATQIGQVMMWAGLPQIFVMPLVPFLLKKIDARVLACVGLLLFASSNYLNSALNANYSGDQFIFSLVTRAIGQPLFIIPLSAIGMNAITPLEAANASAIYNVLRNLGGSIGIALTSTFALSRESLHSARHLENLGASDYNLMQIMKTAKMALYNFVGMEQNSSQVELLRGLRAYIRREALYETFSDIFLMLSFVLLICGAFTVFIKKTEKSKLGSPGIH